MESYRRERPAMAHCKSFRTGLDSGRNCAERLVQQGFAGDRFQRRLTPSVRLLPSSKLVVPALLKQCVLL